MHKEVRVIIWGIVLAILIPLLLSIIIHFPKLCFIAGDEGNWIGFWGSYIGALITLFALYITIQANRKESNHQRLIDYNKQYERDIAESICSLTISRIVECYDQDRKNQLITSVNTTQLEAYKLEIINHYNTFFIIYPEADDAFITQYDKTKSIVVAFIDRLVIMQTNLEAEYNIHEQNRRIAEITKYAITTEPLEESIHSLWVVAQETTKKLVVK